MTGRSVTVREPEYNDRDRALIITQWLEDQEPRNSHGILVADATDPALQMEWEPKARRDFTSEALRRVQKEYEKLYPHADLESLLWRVQRRNSD